MQGGASELLCGCGGEIAEHYAFCPHCGIELRWSTEARRRSVPASADSLCRTLRSCATRTFERLADDHFHGPVPDEEAYTKFNLQDLYRLHSDRVVIREFQRSDEALNGADWEWWFHLGGYGFGMRVQAKRAKRGGGYDLEHVVRRTRARQSELLVQDAQATGCFPAYVLYNHRNWVAASQLGQVVDCRHGRGEQAQLGCTLVSALTVHAVLRSRPVKAAYVRDRSVPWHRLLCDAPQGQQTGLHMAHTATKHLHQRGLDDLRAAVRAEARWARNQDRHDAVARYGPWDEPDELGEDGAMAEGYVPDLDFLHAEREVLGMPIYQDVGDVLERPLSPLPERVRAMIEGVVIQPPDERAAGALLIHLTD
ncbi:DUF6615 family protein [Streptomyces sp. CA-249302]|uniref:DUF6615 family protein n=1 Tax=Streptomyces sp. CA-249302 TaxID=3240058 RepID=UPI003D92E5A9